MCCTQAVRLGLGVGQGLAQPSLAQSTIGAMTGPTLVVMAAGLGSRYGGLKQLDPAGPGGETILEYSVFDALRAGFARVVILLRRDIEQAFRERVGRTLEAHADVSYAFQELDDLPPGFAVPPGRQKPWGTAHAVLCCRRAVHTPFAVINADDFYGAAAFRLLAGHLAAAREAAGVVDGAMVGYELRRTLSEFGPVARGICRLSPEGNLVEIAERTRLEPLDGDARYSEDGSSWVRVPGDEIVSLNTWGFTAGVFDQLEARFPAFLRRNADALATAEYFLPEVVGDLVAEGAARIRVLTTPDRWFGITYRSDLPRLQAAVAELVRDGVYPPSLWGAAGDPDR